MPVTFNPRFRRMLDAKIASRLNHAASAIRAEAPGPERITIGPRGGDIRLSVDIGKEAYYAETGVKGGVLITPQRAKVLSWVDSHGIRRFAKRVIQGAVAAKPWARRAVRAAMRAFLRGR